jgi:hypothetical protein
MSPSDNSIGSDLTREQALFLARTSGLPVGCGQWLVAGDPEEVRKAECLLMEMIDSRRRLEEWRLGIPLRAVYRGFQRPPEAPLKCGALALRALLFADERGGAVCFITPDGRKRIWKGRQEPPLPGEGRVTQLPEA